MLSRAKNHQLKN